jgi:hypothetical protein
MYFFVAGGYQESVIGKREISEKGGHIPNQRGGGVLAGDTASAGSAPLLSVQVASGTESDRLLCLRFFMLSNNISERMVCIAEGNCYHS